MVLCAVSCCYGSDAIQGRITDFSGAALSGATVRVLSLNDRSEIGRAKSGADGLYAVRDIPDGTYSLEASLSGYLSVAYYPVRVEFPKTYNLNYQLPALITNPDELRTEARVFGVAMLGLKLVGGLKVCLSKPGSADLPSCGYTDGMSRFFIAVPAGGYELSVFNGGNLCATHKLGMLVTGDLRRDIVIDDLNKCTGK
jgi:hypothetical protein